MLNSNNLKKDFPIFRHDPKLVYLDSTATSLKPQSVVDKIKEYYEKYSANVFRGIYPISEKATEEFELTRSAVSGFINSKSSDEIIFTRNTTESLNLVAYSLGRKIIGRKDEIVTTIMEHHSNFVTWQILAQETGALFKVININEKGYLNLENSRDQTSTIRKSLTKIIGKKSKILALTYISNVLGTINPLKEIIRAAREINPKIIVVVDGAQAAPHHPIDVQDLDCDFLAFSSHKMLGPTGVGVLWGKKEILEEMFPFNFGGEMIKEVYVDKTIFKESPHKFEAGTPAIGEIIAFKEAINYLKELGTDKILKYENDLSKYCFEKLISEFGSDIKIVGPDNLSDKVGIFAFSFGNFHPHDIAQILAEDKICVRAGNHCAMPLHQALGVPATTRASLYFYNTKEDVDKLVLGLKKVVDTLS